MPDGSILYRVARPVPTRSILPTAHQLPVVPTALRLALREHSACSAGAAAAAAEYARLQGASKGRLIRYTTSWDVYPADSFVGYAAIVFQGSR